MVHSLKARRHEVLESRGTALANEARATSSVASFSPLLRFTGHVLRIYDIDVTRSRETRQTELGSRFRFDREADPSFRFKATGFQTEFPFSIVKSSGRSHFVIRFGVRSSFNPRNRRFCLLITLPERAEIIEVKKIARKIVIRICECSELVTPHTRA